MALLDPPHVDVDALQSFVSEDASLRIYLAAVARIDGETRGIRQVVAGQDIRGNVRIVARIAPSLTAAALEPLFNAEYAATGAIYGHQPVLFDTCDAVEHEACACAPYSRIQLFPGAPVRISGRL